MNSIAEDMWTPFKLLHRTIEHTLANPTSASLTELELCFKKYKQSFSTLLKNPPKNERNRAQLRAGVTEGITVSGKNRTMLISKDLVDEAIIISDMYDLDEFISLELLCTAQRQMPQHPGLPRGLVAILLYYDGRKAITSVLRDLFQVTSGISWLTDVPKEITLIISSFTQSLVDETNILGRIIELVQDLDISKETALLTKNRAFGPKKHQNQVLELFEDIRLALATALYNWSAQRGLPKEITVKLLESLANYNSLEASGSIDDVTMTMLMALLYSYDTSVLQRQEDNNILVQNLPVLYEPEYAQQIYDSLVSLHKVNSKNRLVFVAMLTFGLSLASLRHVPQNLQSSLSKVIEHDEHLVDDAISGKVFEFVYYYILEKDLLYKTEFFYRRLHMMFTDFIDYMHSKVTELRGRADETARTVMSFLKEGIEPPSNLDHSFEMLMLCIGKFYKDNRAGLSLCVEYWGPLDISINYTRSTSRSVSLFKFLRLAGELLPTTLFVPYLKMIAGLTSCERSARNAFNLLKQASGLSGSMTLSWEHFFGSLARYYSNLRQEQCLGTDTIYKNRFLNKSINPQEIEGLHAVLEIIKAVATYDEIARIAICEHPNWAPLHVLLGLLGCSVPLLLKADILKTLSALAKSKETAITLWNNLEDAQIIATIPTTNMYNTCNLEIEIEQNECRLEVYPLSQSILDLLWSLVTTIIPKNLGAGPRKPGFDPYLTFIVDGIFLKFYSRNYKNVAEKWQIANKCLKLLEYLLKIYEVNPQDFIYYERDQNASPGFHIMLQLNTKSELLRLILLIIDEARLKLDEYNKFNEKDILEECALHCLNILEIGLFKQDSFFEAHSIASDSIMLSGLKKILLDINPRSGNPDHILNTTKFITYNNWLPNHSFIAIKILNIVSRQSNVTSQILGIFTQNDRIQMEIRQGFVECLEHDITVALGCSDKNSNSTKNQLKIEFKIKEAVIELLQDCLMQSTPNLTHFLLGFDTSKDINQRQKLGTIDSSGNCMKSIVGLLDNYLEIQRNGDAYDFDLGRLIERTYSLLYSLCANQKTSDTILRYLRTSNDFIIRHLSALPFKNVEQSHVLKQMSYLLKCAAIELKITASNCQISRFQYLCEILVGTNGKSSNNNIPMEFNNYCSHTSNILTDVLINKRQSEKSSNLLLCNLLDVIFFEAIIQPPPKLQFFDNALIGQILNECEIKTEQGLKQINIKRLDQLLNDELRTVQSTIASGQRKFILDEIEALLYFAVKINNDRCKSFATVKFLESWSQVTEILFSCAPDPSLSITIKQHLILEILQKLLNKVVPVQPVFELSIIASGTILLLFVNLRFYYQKLLHRGNDNVIKNTLESTNGDQLNIPSKSNSLSLKFILKNILEWIIVSGVASQKLRINLYAALLNYLHIVKGHIKEDSNDSDTEFYVLRLDKTIGRNAASNDFSQIRMSVEVFLSFGNKLIDIICHDCIAGHDVCKISALSCIDSLLELDSMSGFINFFANRGYLSHIIESLFKSDEGLCRVLNSSPENMKTLYVYESKMAMLLRLASSHVGAELLLSDKILSVLSNMKVFDMHPDFQSNNLFSAESNNFIPPVDARYRQILFPAINLCNCIISTLGAENHSAISQVTHFLLSHCDMIEMVLRAATPFMRLGLLQEFGAITGLIARTTNQEIFTFGEMYSTQDIGISLYRIQSLMLSSLSRFIINEYTFKEMLKTENSNGPISETKKGLYIKSFLEISANLTLFCRNAVANHSADHRTYGILFSEVIPNGDNSNNSLQMGQSLNIIINQLKGSVEYASSQKYVTENLVRQKTNVPDINFDVTAKSTYTDLNQRYNDKLNELSLCAFVTEQCLYLLWCHLDFYMRRSSANVSENSILLNEKILLQDNKQSMTFCDGISNLKKNLISIFNETFCKQLLSTCESQSEMDRGFNEALLRRIKSLIQFVPVN